MHNLFFAMSIFLGIIFIMFFHVSRSGIKKKTSWRSPGLIFGLLGMFIFMPVMAMAATTTATTTSASPTSSGIAASAFLMNVIFPIIGAFIAGLIAIVLNKIRQKFNLQISDSQQTQIENVVQQGIAFAEEKAAAAAKNGVKQFTSNDKLNAALIYIMNAVPQISNAQATDLVTSALGKISGVGASGTAAVATTTTATK